MRRRAARAIDGMSPRPDDWRGKRSARHSLLAPDAQLRELVPAGAAQLGCYTDPFALLRM
jgi:hypothetical protein